MQLLFIGGVGRSGSTLVERMLNEVPGMCGLGEVAQMWHNGLRDNRMCGCGSPFAQCPLWYEIGQRAFGGWHHVDPDRLGALQNALLQIRHIVRLGGSTLPAPLRAQVTEYVGYHTRVYAAAAAITGARTIVDSSKLAALAFCLRWADDLDLKVLHLVRDPRGVAYSWTKRVHDAETGGTVPIPGYPMIRSALSWNAHNAAFDLLARVGARPGRSSTGRSVLRMRYEDFGADAAGSVDTVLRFAGWDADGSALPDSGSGHVDLGHLHSVSGNRMRFQTGRLKVGVDDAWRTALSPGRRGLVGALCAPQLLAYGYPAATRKVRARR